jgi:gliding motility-associated-like protein
LLSPEARAQREFDNWYFGRNAGLRFEPTGVQPLTNGALISGEGCASISDAQGNLLFYTNGIDAWNRQHQIMAGGTNLGAYTGVGELLPNSATQGVTVVPRPGSSSEYYIFTVDAAENNFRHGFRYSVVDMSRQGGLGEVVRKDQPIAVPVGDGRVTEKLLAVRHANQQDIWLLVHAWNSNVFLAYLLTPAGLAAPVLSSGGLVHQGGFNSRNDYNGLGYLKVSPTGRRLALAQYTGALELFDFNYGTGVVSGPRRLPDVARLSPTYYGLEFSPDGNLLYAGVQTEIYQYALAGGAPIRVGQIGPYTGALQLGPDRKIYVANVAPFGGTPNLSVINSPNTPGAGCGFQAQLFAPPNNVLFSYMGLPNVLVRPPVPGGVLVNFALQRSEVCLGDETEFTASIFPLIPDAVVTWDFGEPGAGAGNTATGRSVRHRYAQPGTYTVTMTVREVSGATHSYAQPTGVLPPTVARIAPVSQPLCQGGFVTLSVSPALPAGTTYRWQDGSTRPVLTTRVSGRYWVEVTAPQRCPVRDSLTLTFRPRPQLALGPDRRICAGEQLVLRPGAQPAGTTYRWQDGSTGPELVVGRAGTYSVVVTSPDGCTEQDAVQVRFGPDCPFTIPNIITPNGDGKNDAFAPQGLEPETWTLQVYNRWGRLVYEQARYRNDWDGAGQPAGVYYYLLRHAESGQQLKGWLEVQR